MTKDIAGILLKLIEALSRQSVIRAIGLSGGERPLPERGTGDIDLFVYCEEIPSEDKREQLLRSVREELAQIEIGKLPGGHWGKGDCFLLSGIETWLLYFTLAEALAELDAVLDGRYLGRLDSYYYPIGRLAMWKTMRVLCDKDDFLGSIRRRIEPYPEELAHALLDHHMTALTEDEDLERAVQRRDILFYHFALDLALDHFLQALFALNREYFPSRKRSAGYIQAFPLKPLECEHRLNEVVHLGSSAASLAQSYEIWNTVVQEVRQLVAGDEHRKKGD